MASTRRPLFEDLEPVPVAEISSIFRGKSPSSRSKGSAGRRKGHGKAQRSSQGRAQPGKPQLVKVSGPRFRPSDLQWLKALVCFVPMWELALQYDALIDAARPLRQRGRKRSCRTFEALLLDVCAWRYGSYEWAADNLADLELWETLRTVVEAAFPHNKRMRLSKTPPTRSQNYRFRKKYATDHLRDAMRRRVEQACVTATLATGMLPEGSGSLTSPDPYTYATADGCWLPALSSLTIDDAVDAQTGEILRRYDPDALAYHTHNGKATSPGHLLVMVTVRSPYPKERIVLTARLKSGHNPQVNRNDATIAVNAVIELVDRHPNLRSRLVGLIYDMALSAADFDRLLEAGLIPVSKVPLTSKGEPASQNLSTHTFKTRNGGTVSLNVTAVHGTPCVVFVDGNGVAYYQPLKLVQVKKTDRKHRPQVSTRWSIPDKALVPAHLVGAETRVRHTRTDKELKAKKSRSRALRVFPESDERFAVLAPRRNDSESNNADKKSRMWKGRCRTLRHQSVEFNAIAYQIHMAVTALVAYHNRTGADMSRWFGQHQLPRKVRPQPSLAQAE